MIYTTPIVKNIFILNTVFLQNIEMLSSKAITATITPSYLNERGLNLPSFLQELNFEFW